MTFSLPYGVKPTFVPGRAITGGFCIFDDFHALNAAASDTTVPWAHLTENSGAVATLADADGGAIRCTTGTADNNHSGIQHQGESFKVTQGRGLYFETRVKLSTVASDFLAGFSITAADPITTEPATYIAFRTAGDANLLTEARNSDTTTAVDTGVDLVAATWTVLAFELKRDGKVHFYVDGVQVAAKASWSTNASSIPYDVNVSPFVMCQTASAAAITMDIDYVFAGTDERD